MFTNSLIKSTFWEDSMRDNSFDRTIERNYVQKWRFLIAEYEEVKAGRSTTFRRVGDFYRHHGTCSQTFRKYYNRYLRSGAEVDLLPQRRGPKWRERREPEGLESEIVACRKRGMNRYEVHAALRARRDTVPSPSTIYRVFKRYQLNRRTPAMREEKRRIIKDKIGELGHVELHQLAPRHVTGATTKHGLHRQPGGQLHASGLGRGVDLKKGQPVMFKTLKMIDTSTSPMGSSSPRSCLTTGRSSPRAKTPKSTPSRPC